MTIAITPNDIRAFCSTRLPDPAIDTLIGMVTSKVGACVEASYEGDCAKMVMVYAVCHFAEAAVGGSVTSKRAANGASINIEQYGAGQGLRSTPSGRQAISIDTQGCLSGLFADTFVFGTVGDPNPSLYDERGGSIRGNVRITR